MPGRGRRAVWPARCRLAEARTRAGGNRRWRGLRWSAFARSREGAWALAGSKRMVGAEPRLQAAFASGRIPRQRVLFRPLGAGRAGGTRVGGTCGTPGGALPFRPARGRASGARASRRKPAGWLRWAPAFARSRGGACAREDRCRSRGSGRASRRLPPTSGRIARAVRRVWAGSARSERAGGGVEAGGRKRRVRAGGEAAFRPPAGRRRGRASARERAGENGGCARVGREDSARSRKGGVEGRAPRAGGRKRRVGAGEVVRFCPLAGTFARPGQRGDRGGLGDVGRASVRWGT